MDSKTYRVIKEGVSQKEDGRLVDRPVGAEIEVSATAAQYLLAEGFIEPVESAPRSRLGLLVKKDKEEEE